MDKPTAATHINNLVQEEKSLLAQRWLAEENIRSIDERLLTVRAHLAGVSLGQQFAQEQNEAAAAQEKLAETASG